jgi:hypothetical protein
MPHPLFQNYLCHKRSPVVPSLIEVEAARIGGGPEAHSRPEEVSGVASEWRMGGGISAA